MELYMVLGVLDRIHAAAMTELLRLLEISVAWSNLGEGTATSEHLLLYDLEEQEKVVVSALVSDASRKALFSAAKRKLYIDIPGNGVMMAIPIKSVVGGNNLAYITDHQTTGGGAPAMDYSHELIVVILNENYSDAVMDVARSAGATGGTLFHANGTGGQKSERFFGVSLAQEKDILYILAAASEKAAIMKAIDANCGTQTEIGALCFSLPVSEVAGLRAEEEA